MSAVLDVVANDQYALFTPGPRIARRTPDDWVDEPYTRFTVTPVAPIIGAVIEGIDLAEPLDEELHHQLNRALLEWKVLFFRGQDITPKQHADFAANWGPLESHPFISLRDDQREEQPEVVRLEKNEHMAGYENNWHSDVTWRSNPSLGSVLRAIELPAVGGDTIWADMGAAYDCLPRFVKDRIDGLVAEHDWVHFFGVFMEEATRARLQEEFPPAHHPVVRTHPETGRKTLFVNRGFTRHLVDVDPAESRQLLEILYTQAMFPEYQVRWRWQPGDIAFWDNRSTQHYASSDYHPNRRIMERITVVGDRPF